MRALRFSAVAVLSAVVAAGCGSESATVADGRHFGYVQSVDATATPPTIEVDVAEFLSGEAANAAAVEDGVIAEGESVENDYYIRNPAKDVLTLDAAEDVRVTHVQCPAGCTEGIGPVRRARRVVRRPRREDPAGRVSRVTVSVLDHRA